MANLTRWALASATATLLASACSVPESSTDLVRLATKAAAEAGLAARIRFDRSDLRTLTISDHSVDVLVFAGTLAEATSHQRLPAALNL